MSAAAEVAELHTLGGFTVAEIGKALSLPTPAVGERLNNARLQIGKKDVSLEDPAPADLAARLPAVQSVI